MTTITNIDTAPAGSPGREGIRGRVASLASYTRNADTTAYAASDVISDLLATPKAIKFPGAGRSGKILRASMAHEDNKAGTQNFELYVFDQEPTNFADNSPFALVSADMPKLIGWFDFLETGGVIVTTAGADIVAYQMAVAEDGSGAPHAYTTGEGMALYGIFITRSSYTPISETKVHLRLDLEID